MKTKIMSIFTRTPLHVGCGSSVGAVDQPVVRERHTGYPVIPGSTIKGVLADLWLDWSDPKNPKRDTEGVDLLGAESGAASAGTLLIGEGKLLAFPVRSAKGCFAWITSPLALERYARDVGEQPESLPNLGTSEVLASATVSLGDTVVLEEYPLALKGAVPAKVVEMLEKLCAETLWKGELCGRLAIVNDELFQYFAENACEIANHNRIDDEKGVVSNGALFSQENVHSETMFYSVFRSRDAEDFTKLESKLANEGGLLQIGADRTTGLGWCSVATKEVK